jgi:hypothetical protein
MIDIIKLKDEIGAVVLSKEDFKGLISESERDIKL